VAFTDVNGNDKYNAGKDTLIAALVDTNNDHTVSVGDTIHWGTYPSVIGGTYTSPDDTITAFELFDDASGTAVRVTTADGTVSWGAGVNAEQFSTVVTATFPNVFESFLRDSFTQDPPDEIQVDPTTPAPGPGLPNTQVVEIGEQPGDQAFLDVYIAGWLF
jgi:hypothetical protein